jgi:hypothetical protein
LGKVAGFPTTYIKKTLKRAPKKGPKISLMNGLMGPIRREKNKEKINPQQTNPQKKGSKT